MSSDIYADAAHTPEAHENPSTGISANRFILRKICTTYKCTKYTPFFKMQILEYTGLHNLLRGLNRRPRILYLRGLFFRGLDYDYRKLVKQIERQEYDRKGERVSRRRDDGGEYEQRHNRVASAGA